MVGAGDGTTSPGAEENEVKKKQSGATAPSIGVPEAVSSSEQESKKKASVHANSTGKDDITGTEEDALLVFSEASLKKLQSRTEELKSERAMQKNKFR